tara:strand:+ start:2830 stop:3591 length:762 start_codon:yes stop_codon:yes gene_type:complete
MNKIHFKIIVPFYNVEKWIKICIKSVKRQKYRNFQCILVDDHSTDNTTSIIEKEIEKEENFTLIKSPERTNAGALASIYHGTEHSNPNPEDVIIILDGDDWFINEGVLQKLCDIYTEKQCWMTYGSYMEFPLGRRGKFSKQIPKEVVEKRTFRENEWMSSHLRTYKYKLWRLIKKEDLCISEGKFYPMAADLPTMIPMLEMAGARSCFVEDMLLVYNRTNPNNEDKVNHSLQLSIEKEIRSKKRYPLLEHLIE